MVLGHRTIRPWIYANAIQALSVALAIAAGWYVLSHPDPIDQIALQLVVGIGGPATLAYAGYRIGEVEFSEDQQRTVLGWTLAGMAVFATVGLYIILHQSLEGVRPIEPLYILLVSSTAGGVFGAVGGTTVVRAMSSDFHAEARDGAELDAGTAEATGPSPRRKLSLIGLLADAARRDVIRCLLHADREEIQLDELIEYLLSEERRRLGRVCSGSSDPSERIELALRHVHLPKLEETGLLRIEDETVIASLDGETEDLLRESILPLWSAQTSRLGR